MAHSDPVYLNGSTNATNFVGAAIVNVWNFSSRSINAIAKVAKKSYDEQQYKNTLPLINAVSSRCCRILPRLLVPYPFKSVISMVDFMVNEAIRQTQFENPPKADTVKLFMEERTYELAFYSFKRQFVDKIDDWNAQVIEDINRADTDNDNDLLSSLYTMLQLLNEEFFHIRIDPILKPFFDKIFLLSRTSLVTQQLIDEAQIALGKLILPPEQRTYKEYLESLVETSIKNLSQSDWAMRHLGRGLFRAGLDRLYNKTTDSSRLVTVYAAILELSEPPFPDIYHKVRDEKLKCARELVVPKLKAVEGNVDPVLFVALELLEIIEGPQENRKYRPPVATHVEELAYDLSTDGCILSLPIFQLCSKTQTTDIVNLFDETYKMSLKYIEHV